VVAVNMLTIEVADEEQAPLDHSRLRQAAQQILHDADIQAGEISIAIVDDARMHALNRQYLQHDYPTDVLSFVLDHDAKSGSLDGQIIVSRDYAARESPRYGWTTDDELLLYVIHGCLHLVGYDDTTEVAKQAMREAEARYLQAFGLTPR
jgi:probable rRNA maturation factor